MSFTTRLGRVEQDIRAWEGEEEPRAIVLKYKDFITGEVFQAGWFVEMRRGQYRVVREPYYDTDTVPVLGD
jgi:hypothetical protein